MSLKEPNGSLYATWYNQFRFPQGWRGWLVGHLMAIKNRSRSLWVLSLLDLKPGHHVLEIGFGSGADIRRVAAMLPEGFVAGVDQSEAMLRQARGRNQRSILTGRVELHQGVADRLPFPAAAFDRVFAINVAQFWDSPVDTCRELRRILKPNGLALLAVQPRNKRANEADADRVAEKLHSSLVSAGFAGVRLERHAMRPVSAVCAVGTA